MNKYFILLILSVTCFSCVDDDGSDDANGNWVKYSDFEGVIRSSAVTFTIDDFAYVGLGSDGDDYLKDFWRYDAERNFWEEVASFPGEGRIAAIGFSADGKGYVGTGFNGDLETEELSDFWEYDPVANTWNQKTSFAGSARYGALAFAINGKGYVGTGFDGNYLKDFWSYDPSSDSWAQVISLFGSKRESAFAFVIDGVAYVGGGRNNGQFLYDFWSFLPESDTWNDLSLDSEDSEYDVYTAALGRGDAVSFTTDGLAYVGTGLADSYLSSVYQYDPTTNVWEDGLTGFEGTSRADAVAFTLNNVGYIVTGRSSTQRHDDIWGFEPFAEYDEFD